MDYILDFEKPVLTLENQINELNLDQKIEKRESRLFPIDQKDLSIDSDDEFDELLSFLSSLKNQFFIGGDFNIHIGSDLASTASFHEILDTHALVNHVNFPTHKDGNILDLFITSKDCQYIKNIKSGEAVSDHFSVIVTFNFCKKPPPKTKTISYIPYKNRNSNEFMNDLRSSELITNPKSTTPSHRCGLASPKKNPPSIFRLIAASLQCAAMNLLLHTSAPSSQVPARSTFSTKSTMFSSCSRVVSRR